MAKRKVVQKEVAPVEKPEVVTTATFKENLEDDTVTATFRNGNIEKPFEITLQNMNWGLMEDVEDILQRRASDDDDLSLDTILDFFREYVSGGPKAVPLKHTRTVFKAITGYLSQAFGEEAEKN